MGIGSPTPPRCALSINVICVVRDEDPGVCFTSEPTRSAIADFRLHVSQRDLRFVSIVCVCVQFLPCAVYSVQRERRNQSWKRDRKNLASVLTSLLPYIDV